MSATTPPMAASTTLSVSNCEIRRARLTPSASRTPISRRRCRARESRRFATFAQPITRMMKATMARRVAIASWLFMLDPGRTISLREPKTALIEDVSRMFDERFNAAVAAACSAGSEFFPAVRTSV